MRTGKTSNPEWARKILKLRRRMGLTQSAFASRLHYSAMALSRWERGTHEPPAQAYIQIGNLSGEPESSWFWQRAGFKTSDLSKMVPEGLGILRKSSFPDFEIVTAGSHRRKWAGSAKGSTGGHPSTGDSCSHPWGKGDQMLDLDDCSRPGDDCRPGGVVPASGDTSCLRVRGRIDESADHDNDIVAVDRAEINPRRLERKDCGHVAARSGADTFAISAGEWRAVAAVRK